MSKYSSMTYKQVTKRLKKEFGCKFSHNINWTHRRRITPDWVGFNVYENKNKPIPKGLMNEIFKASGISKKEFYSA